MVKIEKYNATKTYMYPNGEIATPERVLKDYPAILVFPHIITTDKQGQMFFAVENLSAVRDSLNISDELNEELSILEIERIRNEPAPEPVPTAEERIAAAMEYQNLITM